MIAIAALASVVADRLGVRDQVIEQQKAAWEGATNDATEFLNETLERWDAQHHQRP